MLAKLSIRNMKRSAKDYMIYILTMTIVTALMYAFNSLIFQNSLQENMEFETAGIMEVMIGLSTVFIVLIVAWLINYMVRFMLEKRSSEFGIYLLLGMKKKTISRLYMRENTLLGTISFLIGLFMGVLLQQILMSVLYAMVRLEYRLHISFHSGTILLTLICYGGCYLLALIRCRRKFKKMNIHALMNAKRKNEEIKEKNENVKKILLPLSVLFLLLFWTLFGRLSNTVQVVVFLIGLVLTIYLFYMGLSAWVICYVRKKGNGIYKRQNLFLLRQFSSKVRTMQFTMGTLSALFTLALMGSSVAFMFSEYENSVLNTKFPFDIQIYSGNTDDDFSDEKEVIEKSANVLEYYQYHIYTDRDDQVNAWLLMHLRSWGRIFYRDDGSPDEARIKDMLQTESIYYAYDTYMSISDYNHLRKMLGYEQISLNASEYLIHIKSRLAGEVQEIGSELDIKNASCNFSLDCAGIYSEPFSQDGHNGADYIVVVPDEVLTRMQPYYSELAVDIEGNAPAGMQKNLEELSDTDEFTAFFEGDLCCGSDEIVVFGSYYLIRDNLIPEVKYMLASLIFPLFYIGLVFVCVAVTVLSIQQLSDSAKYKFRYDVLSKLGLSRSDINRLIFKQLSAFYLCPAFLAIVISGKMILFASRHFVLLTGVKMPVIGFFAESILLFFGIYLVYFAVTFIGFKRNMMLKELLH